MSRPTRFRRLRTGVVLGLAALVLAAPRAFGSAPAVKPPPPPRSVQSGGPGDPGSSAGNQYAPAGATIITTLRARKVGLCKKAVAKRFLARRFKCKTKKCRAQVRRDQAAAVRRCDSLMRG